MADSEDKLSLSVRHYNQRIELLGGRTRHVSYRAPTVVLRMESTFIGPYKQNWLYLSAQEKANYGANQNTLVPFPPDSVTVDSSVLEGDTIRWTCLERVREFRSWNAAVKAMLLVSGGVYGGTTRLIKRDGDYDLLTDWYYTNHVRLEAAFLVPVIAGRILTASMNKANSIAVEVEVSAKAIIGLGPDDLIGGEWQDAIANSCIANAVMADSYGEF